MREMANIKPIQPKLHVNVLSADQVDLNFADPAVLLEFVDILLFYVAAGVQVVRLDAVIVAIRFIALKAVPNGDYGET